MDPGENKNTETNTEAVETPGQDLDELAIQMAEERFGKVQDPEPGKTEGNKQPGADPSPGGDPPAPGADPQDPKPGGDPPSNFSEQQALEQLFGEGKFTDFKTAKQTLGDKNKELTQMRDANLQLTQKVQSAINPFKTEQIYLLNELAKKANTDNIGVLSRIAQSDVASMSEMDAMKLQYMIDNPAYAERPDLVETIINQDFKMDEELEGTAKEVNDLRFKSKAQEAKTKITALKNDVPAMPNTDNIQQELQADKSKAIEQWKPIVSKVVEHSFKELVLDAGDEKTHKHVIKPELAQQYLNDGLNYAAQLPLEEKSVKNVVAFIHNKYIVENFKDIVSSLVTQARSLEREKWDAEQRNPGMVHQEVKPPSKNGTEQTSIEQILEFENQ